jgi:uncharacterized protein YdhG (YjbR/CyaY superfamily)
MATETSVDTYIDALPAERRGPMAQLRATVRAAAPTAEEVMTYKMPGLRLAGRFLVSYDAFARHYSLFPASDGVRAALGEELVPYLAGKGTIRFRADAPLPLDLVRRVVEARVAEVGAG